MVVFGLPHSQRMVGESPGAPLGGAIVTPCGTKEGRWDKNDILLKFTMVFRHLEHAQSIPRIKLLRIVLFSEEKI